MLHTDDTTVPGRDEMKNNHQDGRSRFPSFIIIIRASSSITPSRMHAMAPAEFLKTFKGFLQADAYGGYDGIYTVTSTARLSKSAAWPTW